MSAKLSLTFGYACDIGKVREYNEDAVYTFFAGGNEVHSDFGLFIVCDGIGGKGSGIKAAKLAIQQLAIEIHQAIYIPLLNGEKIKVDNLLQSLVEGVRAGNTAILKWGDDEPDKRGGGTSITAVVVLDRTAYIAHVGDTGCYAVQHEKLEQLTEDHNIISRLIKGGYITQQEADEHPHSGYRLYRALGQSSDVEVDTYTSALDPESALLLCSDGILIRLKDHEILETIRASHSPRHACDNLIALANEHGGYDNSAVILISNGFPFAGVASAE